MERLLAKKENEQVRMWVNFENGDHVLFPSRVYSDLENLEESGNLKQTFERQGICLKSQGTYLKYPKLREVS